MLRQLNDACFGVTALSCHFETGEKIGSNGLPLASPSIQCYGRFHNIKNFYHPNLTLYLDIIRGKHESIFIVTEHYKNSVDQLVARKPSDKFAFISEIATSYLFFLSQNDVRITNYAVDYITNGGKFTSFPITFDFTVCDSFVWRFVFLSNLRYMPPEDMCKVKKLSCHAGSAKTDVWALGIIILELVTGKKIWSDNISAGEIVKMMLSWTVEVGSDGHVLDQLLSHTRTNMDEISEDLKILLIGCLYVHPSRRLSCDALLKLPIFSTSCSLTQEIVFNIDNVFTGKRRSDLHTVSRLHNMINDPCTQVVNTPLSCRPLREVYRLWQMAGSDVASILGADNNDPTDAQSIRALPLLAVDEFEIFGSESNRLSPANFNVHPLSLKNVIERTKSLEPEYFFPLFEIYENGNGVGSFSDNAKLPTVIKERDIAYQLRRQSLFERLVNAYPFKRSLLWREARIDVCPLYRAQIWAALLSVEGDVELVYKAIDKISPTPIDRQIEVDIPRCHQYDALLSSPMGHEKLKRVLKAWLSSNPNYVYWQGLDSLAAPFVYLNFSNEALAFASFSAFIPKYLFNFFLKDNSAVIHEYLAIFNHLIAFHDPTLFVHLTDIGFVPDLYAIPWFLTMFAHVFPLQKIFHLWDTLLLGSYSFPLCVGVAILVQLRPELLKAGFNECILMFSDLPDIDIEQCVQDAIRIFCNTPKSATIRAHCPIELAMRERSVSASFMGYSVDTNGTLGMLALPLNELRTDQCPRICAQELIDLCKLPKHCTENVFSDPASPGAMRKTGKILVVDVRKEEDYMKGTFPGALNLPWNVFSPVPEDDENVIPSSRQFSNGIVEKLRATEGKIVVVMGTSLNQMRQAAEKLVEMLVQRVCFLHNGIEVLRFTDLLTVPSQGF